MVSPELFNAAAKGEIATVQNWLVEGGDPRLAGHSYKRWVLKDYMALVRVRSLLARGRARHGPETTVVVARLFDTSTAAAVPDGIFWLVVEYAWLGDWRHP